MLQVKSTGNAQLTLPISLYTKEAILATSYRFTGKYDVMINQIEPDNWFVQIIPKTPNESHDMLETGKTFLNDLIDEQIRSDILRQTGDLQQIIIEHAFLPISPDALKKKLQIKAENKKNFTFLPFFFKRRSGERILLTTMAGEFLEITAEQFDSFTSGTLNTTDDVFLNLESIHAVTKGDIDSAVQMLAVKYRSRKAFLKEFTSLHMIVLTCGCNCQCRYCQTSSQAPEEAKIHMTRETAKNVVKTIFQCPSPRIKIEFQGGEPTLNWDVLQYIVEYTRKINKRKNQKYVDFVLCSNMTSLTDKMLYFLRDNNIMLSTSLDGPKELHDRFRILRNGSSSYEAFMGNLLRARKIIGKEAISPLVTITGSHLSHLRKIIDEYIRLGFDGIFLRPVNPYGFARDEWKKMICPVDKFVEAYKENLDYIINQNLQGHYFIEFYTMLLLTRILTPFSTGFVDLQSPTGAGISGVIYDYDGGVYPTDEARMLARCQDKTFYLGNVNKDTYQNIFNGPLLREIVGSSCLEFLPGCKDCVYQAFCGSDPVRNYVEYGNTVGHRSNSDFCKKNKAIFDHLFEILLARESAVMDVFWSWITGKRLGEIST